MDPHPSSQPDAAGLEYFFANYPEVRKKNCINQLVRKNNSENQEDCKDAETERIQVIGAGVIACVAFILGLRMPIWHFESGGGGGGGDGGGDVAFAAFMISNSIAFSSSMLVLSFHTFASMQCLASYSHGYKPPKVRTAIPRFLLCFALLATMIAYTSAIRLASGTVFHYFWIGITALIVCYTVYFLALFLPLLYDHIREE